MAVFADDRRGGGFGAVGAGYMVVGSFGPTYVGEFGGYVHYTRA